MSDIFLSYSSSEKERINPIVQLLKQQGWSVWWDRKIPPGKTFDEVIEEALNAAKCVVVVWSAESIKSNWIKTEAQEGLERGILIPILIDDVTIPFEFRRIQAARITDLTKLSSDAEVKDFLNSVAALIGKPPSKEFIKQDTVLSLEKEEVLPKEKTKEKIETEKHVELLKYDSRYLRPVIIVGIILIVWIIMSDLFWENFFGVNFFGIILLVTLVTFFVRPVKPWLACRVILILHFLNLMISVIKGELEVSGEDAVLAILTLISVPLLNAGIAALICRFRLKSPRFIQIQR